MHLMGLGFIAGCIFTLIVFAIIDKFSCIWGAWKTVRIEKERILGRDTYIWREIQRRECVDCGKAQRRTITT